MLFTKSNDIFENTLPHEKDDLELYTKCEEENGSEGVFIQQV